MPQLLKNLYNQELIALLSCALEGEYSEFDVKKFKQFIFDNEWHQKELKQRIRHIAIALQKNLPANYQAAIKILTAIAPKFGGLEAMIFPDYVELYGLDEYKTPMVALAHFTKYSSSEFAVRPFIKKYDTKMMLQMHQWALSSNHHVRRLASEGCRPRLPWAMALLEFKKNPAPVLAILEKLKNDTGQYVRRSVANNLNDISKDNPKILKNIANTWVGKTAEIDWIVKHACRTLLKQGDSEIMNLFGFFKPVHINISKLEIQKSICLGDRLDFSFVLATNKPELGKLRIEYAIGFLKKNGSLSKKVFKVSEAQITQQKKAVSKSHSFKIISTRRYYVGIHELSIIVNGCELASHNFMLS